MGILNVSMRKALLLNADWSPLQFVSDIRAIMLIYRGRAEVVNLDSEPSLWGDSYKTPMKSVEVPATIRLLKRINPTWAPPRFRKRVLFNRDGWRCQYCTRQLTWSDVTIDHVVPRCSGGKTTWRNCVASCKECNRKKGFKSLSEAGMNLIKSPLEPSPLHFFDYSASSSWHDHWNLFVPITVCSYK